MSCCRCNRTGTCTNCACKMVNCVPDAFLGSWETVPINQPQTFLRALLVDWLTRFWDVIITPPYRLASSISSLADAAETPDWTSLEEIDTPLRQHPLPTVLMRQSKINFYLLPLTPNPGPSSSPPPSHMPGTG